MPRRDTSAREMDPAVPRRRSSSCNRLTLSPRQGAVPESPPPDLSPFRVEENPASRRVHSRRLPSSSRPPRRSSRRRASRSRGWSSRESAGQSAPRDAQGALRRPRTEARARHAPSFLSSIWLQRNPAEGLRTRTESLRTQTESLRTQTESLRTQTESLRTWTERLRTRTKSRRLRTERRPENHLAPPAGAQAADRGATPGGHRADGVGLPGSDSGPWTWRRPIG
jgi:hypothetical protein